MAPGRALIDVQKGELTLRVNKEEIMFNIYQAMRFPEDPSTCFRVDVIKQCVEEAFQEDVPADSLERSLQQVTSLSNVLGRLEPMEVKMDAETSKEKMQQTTTPELKQLPQHLRYAFLGDSYTFPVIIAASLTSEEEEKLLHVLREHRTALGWTISDIKGISPSICMHKILMDELYKPSIEHQTRLNLAIKEVVRAEILKLLNVGIIYAISDSSWVSPVQVVPKKGGMTVVKNDNNELIPTRTVTGWRVCVDYRKLNKATRKDHFPLPFIDQMLD